MKNRVLLVVFLCASAAGGWFCALVFQRPGPRVYAGQSPAQPTLPVAPIAPIAVAPKVESAPQVATPPVLVDSCPAEAAARESKDSQKVETKVEAPKIDAKPIVTTVAPPAEHTLRLRGRVVSNMDVEVKCKVGGQISALPLDVGDSVKKGQLLVELDTTDEERAIRRAQITLASSETRLAQAREGLSIAEKTLVVSRTRMKAQLKSSQIRAERARTHADRIKQTLNKNFTSQEEFDDAEADAAVAGAALDVTRAHAEDLGTQEAALELKRHDIKLAQAQVEMDKLSLSTAQQRMHEAKVYSPLDGVITGRYVQSGSVIASGMSMQGTRIMTVSDLSQLWVVAPVDLAHMARFRVGKLLSISSEAFPGEHFRGRVAKIAPRGVSGPGGVSFEAKIEILDDAKNLLKPEMPVEVNCKLAGS